MEILILDAINNLKDKKKRPSVEAIYDMIGKDKIINDLEFCETFKILEAKKIIKNIKPK